MSLCLTLFAWRYSHSQVKARVDTRFDSDASQVIELVRERMQKYEDALWSGTAFVVASNDYVNFDEWQRFADRLHIETKYPGINGIGVIHSVSRADKDAYLELQRRQRPDFDIHPLHEEMELMPISYIVPVRGNEQAVGLDMAHEANRFSAARNSRRSGQAQITGPIILVQDAGSTPGFLFYAPFYDREELDNEIDRVEHFQGMVYAPFVMKKLMEGTLEKTRREVGIRILDGDEVLYDEHVESETDYDSDPLYTATERVDLYGRTWTFDIRSAMSFRDSVSFNQPLTILFSGLLIDTLLIGLFFWISQTSRRALRYADQMTRSLQEQTVALNESLDKTQEVERKTREAEQRLQSILDNTTAVVYAKRLDGTYLLINNQFSQLFGITQEEIAGLTDHDLFPVPIAEELRANDVAVAESGKPIQLEEKVPNNGEIRTYVTTKFPMYDADGRLIAVAGISTDITAAKNAEHELEIAKRRIEHAVDGASDGLWDWPDVNQQEEWWSPQFYRMLGYEPGEVRSTLETFRAHLHPDDYEHTLQAVTASLEQGVSFDVRYRLRVKGEGYRWFRSRAKVYDSNTPDSLRMAGTMQDIHDLVVAQDALNRLNKDLDAKNHEMEQFVYTASHDLKSPIVTIQGFLGHLGRDLSAGRTDRLTQFAKRARNATVRMRENIDDLLELSRVGQVTNMPDTVIMADLVQQAAEQFDPQIEALQARVIIDEDLPHVLADRRRIAQVLENLFSNSLRFTTPDTPPVIHIGSDSTDDEVRYFFRDNGPGIPSEYHEKVFKLFHRLETGVEGTGVGLAIVKRIMESHEGRVWIESEAGKGTTFWLAFPRSRVLPSVAPSPESIRKAKHESDPLSSC